MRSRAVWLLAVWPQRSGNEMVAAPAIVTKSPTKAGVRCGNGSGNPSGPPRIELEPILRLVFADQGDREDALRAIAVLRRWAKDHIVSGTEILREYQEGAAPFPDRLHIAALASQFYSDLFHTMAAFTDFAEAEIKKWPRTDRLGLTPRSKEILDELVQREDPAAPQPPSAERSG
jgi:PadR family transcriptional regulator AphA